MCLATDNPISDVMLMHLCFTFCTLSPMKLNILFKQTKLWDYE